jgi:hypothetical protein
LRRFDRVHIDERDLLLDLNDGKLFADLYSTLVLVRRMVNPPPRHVPPPEKNGTR